MAIYCSNRHFGRDNPFEMGRQTIPKRMTTLTRIFNERSSQWTFTFIPGHVNTVCNQTECSVVNPDGSAAVNLSLWFHCSICIRWLFSVAFFRLVQTHLSICLKLDSMQQTNRARRVSWGATLQTECVYVCVREADEDKQNAAVRNFTCKHTPIVWQCRAICIGGCVQHLRAAPNTLI